MAKKPRYKDPAGLEGEYAAVPSQPPFLFRNVNARVFPIKANMAQLGYFVHQYLNNDIPSNIVHFRPALPYVYMLMLNYGSLEPGSVEARNIGWISQNEVVFSIPLERWQKNRNGQVVFHDWACVNPFIFVDDDASLTTGREVYGWPKVKAEIQEEAPQWTKNPRNPTCLLNLKTKLFPKLFAGAREEDRELLQIYRDPPPCFSQIPLDPRNPWFPLSALQTAVSGWVNVMTNALDIIAGLPIGGYRAGRDPSTLLRMLCRAGSRASHFFPNPYTQGLGRLHAKKDEDPEPPKPNLTQITLKQFHHPEKPFDACYQAIIGSDIALDSLNRIGFLGDENLLRGDPSGGFTIRIACYDAQPIVDKLGLEKVMEEGGDPPVSIFKPTLPIWADIDLYYGKGRIICSRPDLDEKGQVRCSQPKLEDNGTPRASWNPNEEENGKRHFKTQSGLSLSNKRKAIRLKKKDKDNAPSIPYNTVRGGATQPIAGPFTFPDITVQVYPLEANKTKLTEYLNEYLNDTLDQLDDEWGMKFEPWGSRVYLIVSIYDDKHGKMFSDNNNIGNWIEKEVAISIPVKWFEYKVKQTRTPKVKGNYYKDKDGKKYEKIDRKWFHKKFVNWGLVSPFLFGNTGRAVISDREINGRPMVKAEIESHKDVWLTSSGPKAQRMLFKLDTEIYPGLYMAQRAEERTLIEIVEGQEQQEKSDGNNKSQTNQEKGDSKEAAEEILKKPQTINRLHLKQHRDAQDSEGLCYQALVKTTRIITDFYEFTAIKKPINIRIHKYPGRPIADLLGLQDGQEESSGDNVVEIFKAVDPFWMHAHMYEPLGEVVCYRLKSQPWVVSEEAIPFWQNSVKRDIED